MRAKEQPLFRFWRNAKTKMFSHRYSKADHLIFTHNLVEAFIAWSRSIGKNIFK